METTVERIRRYCKEKGVAVSVLYQTHFFGNENGNKKDPPGGYPSGLYAGYLFW